MTNLTRVPVPSACAKPASLRTAGEVLEVTVLLTDLRGFVALWESSPGPAVFDLLNRYLKRMCEITAVHSGRVDKFIGDAVMAVFDASQADADHALRAVTCAVQMQIAMDEINRESASLGLPAIYMGAGIGTGPVIAGMLGSALHSEYTVVGEAANLASRIQSLSLRGQILVGETTFARCRGHATTGPQMEYHLKGKSQLLRLHEVLAIPALGLFVPRREMRNGPRVRVGLPFTYLTLLNNVVLPDRREGTVHNLAYNGALVEIPLALARHHEVMLEMDLPFIGRRVRGIYARVRRARCGRGRNLAGLEFTSISQQAEKDIREAVQLLTESQAMVAGAMEPAE